MKCYNDRPDPNPRLTGADAYAVFDRALAKLDTPVSGMLQDHPDLSKVLSKYGIRLIAT